MKIRVFRAGHGDALLLTSSGGKNILVDGGEFHAYEDHWAQTVAKMREDGEVLDLVCVSHTDRDHIGGILRMLDNEVKWRVHEFRLGNSPRSNRRPPKLRRPPEVKAIWHNAFLEKARRRQFRSSNRGQAVLDVSDILFRSAMIHAGAGDTLLPSAENGEEASVVASRLADRLKFLGQSVGDAIELSRRIGAKQLNIPLNPEFGGEFVLRKRHQDPFDLGDLAVTVLGPTQSDMNQFEKKWNSWLRDNASWLKTLQKRHDKSARQLHQDDLSDILDAAREASITLAGNQNVTAPNLASIVMLVEEGDHSILLTGDADDPDILDGLKAAGRLDADGRIRVTTYKVPHHGAHNSYSNKLASRIIADDYIFCGDGANTNPEIDVITGYLEVLFEGRNGFPPALPSGVKPTFWFNDGPKVASSKYRDHWDRVEDLLKVWKGRLGTRFRYKLMSSGDSFLVR
ncbi:MAG: MBL fold metallo-hydrolase [Anderseniella sp.]